MWREKDILIQITFYLLDKDFRDVTGRISTGLCRNIDTNISEEHAVSTIDNFTIVSPSVCIIFENTGGI
jgi:hypothetical protein